MDNPIPPTSIAPTPPVSPVIPSLPPKSSLFPIFFVVLILVLLAATGVFAYQNWQLRQQLNAPTTYAECIKTPGSILQESYPATCITKDGKRSFKQILTDEEKKKLQPPDETTNWKTYTDDDFSLQYPSEWKTNPGTNSFKQGDAISIYTTVQYNAKVSNQNFLLTAAKPVQTTLGLRDWIDRENILTAYTGNEAPKLSKDAILGGEPAVKIEGCGGGCFTFLYTKYNGKIYAVVYPSGGTVPENIQKTFNQILSTFKFIENNPLNSTFSVTLPDPFQLMRSTKNIASYGFDTVEYLVVTNIPTINLKTLRPSTECGNLTAGQFCLNDGKGWGQAKDIADVIVDGIPAKSFYISGGNDNAYHVVQTTQAPVLEFKMFVAGGGLDQRFQNFLATIKFL